MRRILCILLTIVFLFLAGCELPLLNEDSGLPASEELTSTTDTYVDADAVTDTDTDNDSVIDPVASMEPGASTEAGNATETDSTTTSAVVINPMTTANPPSESANGNASSIYMSESDMASDSSGSAVMASQIEESNEKMPMTLYYQDSDGCLIPVVKWVEKQQGIARMAINSLVPSTKTCDELLYFGLYPVLPEGTELLGINIVDDVILADFNAKFSDFDSEHSERNAITSLVYTLTEFESIAGVKILINGYEKETLKYGTDISGVLERKDIFINPDGQDKMEGSGIRTGANKVDIYFFKKANEGFTYLLPVSIMTDDIVGGEMAPAAMMQFLLKTDPGGEIYSEIPEGTALLDCNNEDGILTLNLDENFINYGGSSREDGIIQQLLFTLKQDWDIERVKILIDGKAVVLPEGTDVSRGLTMPLYINDVLDK